MPALPVVRWRSLALGVLLAVGLTVTLDARAASADATVGVAATTTVNIRTGPGLHYRVTGQLERGQRIRAYAPIGSRWAKVRFAGAVGYMARDYLSTSAALAGPARTNAAGTKITTARLNLRAEPTSGGPAVGTLAEGTRLRLTGRMTRGYAETRYAGQARWVSLTYLARLVAAPSSATPAPAPSAGGKGRTAYAFARTQLGRPYRYGAVGPDAYDCSGLTLTAWRKAGITLPRTSARQFYAGQRVARSDLRVGDLIFYYGPTPSHVALYAGNGRIIHAPRPGKVVEQVPIDYMPYAGAVRPG